MTNTIKSIAKDYNVTTTVLFTLLLLCLQQVHFYSHSWNTFTVNLQLSFSGFEIHISIILVGQCHSFTLSTPFAHYTSSFLSRLFFAPPLSLPQFFPTKSLSMMSHWFSFLNFHSHFHNNSSFYLLPHLSVFFFFIHLSWSLRFSSSLWTK